MGCVSCRNYEISRMGAGLEVSHEDLARMMLSLQEKRCHNSGGYDSAEILRLIDGVFDIYMPDFKYPDDETGESLSAAVGYATAAREAVREMFRQVGDLATVEVGSGCTGVS